MASLKFTAIACNRVSEATDWAADGWAAVAAHCFIALYRPQDPTSRGIIATLRGHTDRVNCVRFLKRGSGLEQRDVALVSGSADRTLRIWRRRDDGRWYTSAILSGHTAAVTCLAVARGRYIPSEQGEELLASAASDGTIRTCVGAAARLVAKLMIPSEDIVNCVQVINVGAKYPMCLAIAYLPNSNVPVLVAGGTDNKITVYVRQNGEFTKTLSLQGHTDWIRSLEIATYTAPPTTSSETDSHFKDGDLVIATGSQDKYIRLWRISDATDGAGAGGDAAEGGNKGRDLVGEMMEALAGAGMEDGAMQLSTKAHVFEVVAGDSKRKYTIMFHALLMGHDDWVHSLNWQPAKSLEVDGQQRYHQPMSLLSASADKSIMAWRPDERSGLWVEQSRVGEIGGSTLGFYGAVFSPDGKVMMGNGYNGAVHLWAETAEDEWTPQIGLSGHFAPVEDLAWDPSGAFLMSTSLDQTTRLYLPWRRGSSTTWHECARPQIHGYDLKCLAFVHKYGFVSGADEKIVRVFEAPATFVSSLRNLTGEVDDEDTVRRSGERPMGASIPALGLSNKAVYEADTALSASTHDDRNRVPFTSATSTPTSLTESLTQPPFEQHLLQHTLWPEVNKLYGHGYEIVSVASSHRGDVVASACKAAKPQHAAIRLWSTRTWKELCAPLAAHALTVTGIVFSPNDERILSVGRDRAWAVFEKCVGEGGEVAYNLVSTNPKAHARIVWSGAWTFDGTLFATGSRDKSVKIWGQNSSKEWLALSTLKFDEGVTAVDFVPWDVYKERGGYMLAVGLENGRVIVYKVTCEGASCSVSKGIELPSEHSHQGSVKRVKWRPRKEDSEGIVMLATCGEDHSVRLFAVK
ncbi:Elongator subunit elp2, partial [Borealophlyctis nickersoniae]